MISLTDKVERLAPDWFGCSTAPTYPTTILEPIIRKDDYYARLY